MNMQQHKPITAKELEYLVDSMSNEDLLMKQCTAAAFSTQNQNVRSACLHMLDLHQQHYHTLMNTLQQHYQMAPTQPQQ
ncbi:hypothetical protein [Paenibacillus gansuensis]|uniref:Spore coat protein n=1 Tax=Paenibacillus gansuensis TaxID=306542 RepID=A0ABW5PJK1_9BACL